MEATDGGFELSAYYPIFIYLVIVLGFAITNLIVVHFIGPRTLPSKYDIVKFMPYESGMDPIGDARQRFDIKYYLIAIMFLVFDVELLFLYPWVSTAYRADGYNWLPEAMRHTIFWSVIVFIALLAVAYLYDLKKGVFKWR